MDTDITPIFENDDENDTVPHQPVPQHVEEESKDLNEHCSRLADILDPPAPPPEAEYSYMPQQQQQQFPHPMYAPLPPQYHLPEPVVQQVKWDPFSTIGATAWVALGIAFIIGFIVGKLR